MRVTRRRLHGPAVHPRAKRRAPGRWLWGSPKKAVSSFGAFLTRRKRSNINKLKNKLLNNAEIYN